MSQAVSTEHYPLPPEDLRWRAAGMREADGFLQSSSIIANFLDKEALARDGKSFKDFNSILDFGCGCGRLIRALRPLCDPWATIQGTDIDPAAIKWCKENIADASFSVNGESPPLPFADKSIDLICACSVYTHMDADRQFRWLAELQRILKPGGYLLATFRHQHSIDRIADHDIRERILTGLNSGGIAFMASDAWKSVFPAWYGEAYHTPEYIRKNWGSYFEVRHIVTAGTLEEETAVLRARESTFLQRVFRRP